MSTTTERIKTGTGSSLGTGKLSAPMFRHATLGRYRVHYWPDGGGSQGFIHTDGIGWTVDTDDEMPHEVWIQLLQAIDAPTYPEKVEPAYAVRPAENVLIRFNPLRYIPAWQVVNPEGIVVNTLEDEAEANRQAYLLNRHCKNLEQTR